MAQCRAGGLLFTTHFSPFRPVLYTQNPAQLTASSERHRKTICEYQTTDGTFIIAYTQLSEEEMEEEVFFSFRTQTIDFAGIGRRRDKKKSL